MKNFYNYLFLGLLLALISGCATIKPAEVVAPPRQVYWSASGGASALLTYFDQLRLLSAPELAKETERARKNYAKDKSTFYQLQYAIALSVPGGDIRQAQQLLDPLVKETRRRDLPLRALAVMVSTNLAERQRLEEALQTQIRRADDLDAKLEALKGIEKKMMQREDVIKGKP
ncbi:MAG: hypothetical protein Q7T00_06990 [Rugosibacter sp.]|jgi:hypothetical protein|nr:hypothetical protein [Rugosibacter sp.]MDO9271542.1 hypothetical protein [Rugosibacter sp.]